MEITINTRHLASTMLSPIGVLSVVGLGILLYGNWPLGEVAAAWVQAIFSVVAIFAAWIIPYRHELRREKRQRQAVLDTIGALATRQGILHKRLLTALEGGDDLLGWQLNDELARWRTHCEVLNSFPAGSLIGFDISYLVVMKEAADFGVRCATHMMKWNPEAMPRFEVEEDPSCPAEWHMRQVAGVAQMVLQDKN